MVKLRSSLTDRESLTSCKLRAELPPSTRGHSRGSALAASKGPLAFFCLEMAAGLAPGLGLLPRSASLLSARRKDGLEGGMAVDVDADDAVAALDFRAVETGEDGM